MATRSDNTDSESDPEPLSDAGSEVNQPGLAALREVVINYTRRELPTGAKLRDDAVAGLNSAVNNVTDGMASGLLAGVNPLYGLYANIAGPLLGGIFSSTRLMMITTTSASALAAGQTLRGLPEETRIRALFLLVILIGVVQLLFSVLRIGWVVSFVSYSVMTGFLTGIATLLVLSQLPTLMGYTATGDNTLLKTWDLLTHLPEISPGALGVGLLTLVLVLTLRRTPIGNFGSIISVVVPSLLVMFLNLDDVPTVRSVGSIPSGIPSAFVPQWSDLSIEVLVGALAIALIIVVQAAGVSQSVPNPDGSRRSVARDSIAQGAGNIVAGIFQGLPVGGSLGATALNVLSGARSHWASIFAGLWMAVIVFAFPAAVSFIAMPALGALLILAGIQTVKIAEAHAVWTTGWSSRIAAVVTFLATLWLPVADAVGIGVALSTFLYLTRSSTDITLVELIRRDDGHIEEHKVPKRLKSHHVTVLDVYGYLFHAGAKTLERMLPVPEGADHPVVILRLRGDTSIGATLINVLANYADRLEAVHGRLYLSGISKNLSEQVVRAAKLVLTGPVRTYKMTPVVGESTHEAYKHAMAWLVETQKSREGERD